jgi:hypothetical protein
VPVEGALLPVILGRPTLGGERFNELTGAKMGFGDEAKPLV